MSDPEGLTPPPACACWRATGFADYALLDSGTGRKLERFGRFTVDRPEPQAMWSAGAGARARVAAGADAQFKAGGGEEDGEGGAGTGNKPLPETGR